MHVIRHQSVAMDVELRKTLNRLQNCGNVVSSVPAIEIARMHIETRRYRVASGISLTADVAGNPAHPSVILQHGGGQTRHSWGTAVRELVTHGYHVVNLDARGHGESDWAQDGDYSIETLSSDLCTVIATLSSSPALVGASMGAASSLYAVGNSQAQIAAALVLVDLVPRINPAGAAKILAFMSANPNGFANLDEAADAVAAYNPHRPRPKDASGLMKNLRHRDDGRLHWHWDPRFVIQRDAAEPPRALSTLQDAARRVRIPTLLVRGMQSDVVDEQGVEELKSILPTVEVFDVVGAGHMIAGDKNDAFNHGVLAFLKRRMPGATS
jgi:pimeloyl-ACP methyl ester carboxylesterase